jgi:hypothetical protein
VRDLSLNAQTTPGGTLEGETPAPRRWRRRVITPDSDSDTEADELPGLKGVDNLKKTPTLAQELTPPQTLTYDTTDFPKHMADSNQYLTEDPEAGDRNWGDPWLACLREFIEFQRQAGFPDAGPSFPASTNIRPPEIAVWMKNGRRWRDMELDDHERFGKQWWAWWSSLQPSSQLHDDPTLPSLPTVAMDWTALRKPGKNGLLLFMVSLAWWGKASDACGEWLKAVLEVTNVLRCLQVASGTIVDPDLLRQGPLGGSSAANVAASTVTAKRKRGGGNAGGSSKKAKLR